jgi:hypothetical protein
MDAITILKEKLIGNFYSRFSVGDTYDLLFDHFWLISNGLRSPDEGSLNSYLFENYPATRGTSDKEDISKCTILAATRYRKILDLSLTTDCTLQLEFENNVVLQFPTNTEIVDWQWAINENGKSPYENCMVGCFWQGEMQVNAR